VPVAAMPGSLSVKLSTRAGFLLLNFTEMEKKNSVAPKAKNAAQTRSKTMDAQSALAIFKDFSKHPQRIPQTRKRQHNRHHRWWNERTAFCGRRLRHEPDRKGRRCGMKQDFQHVVIAEKFFYTTMEEYVPVLYEIEVDDHCLVHISEDTARYIHKELGRLLSAREEQKSPCPSGHNPK